MLTFSCFARIAKHVIAATCLIIVGIFHHYVVSGKWFDLGQIMHHEAIYVAIAFFVVGFAIAVCKR